MIRIDSKYVYRNGSKAQILCCDKAGLFPVLSIDEEGGAHHHYPSGLCDDLTISEWDLMPIDSKFQTTKYLAIYQQAGGSPYTSAVVWDYMDQIFEQAARCGVGVYAVVTVDIDVQRGEGVDG